MPRTLPGRLCARSRPVSARGSGREPVATFEPACPDDRSSGARRHPVPETVILRPLPGVGLVGPLHSLSSFESSFEVRGNLCPRSAGMLNRFRPRPDWARRSAHARRVRSRGTTQEPKSPAASTHRRPDRLPGVSVVHFATSSHTDPGVPFGRRAPRQAATSPERDSEALQARGPLAWRRVGRLGCPGRQSTPVDCLVDDSGYEGPRSR